MAIAYESTTTSTGAVINKSSGTVVGDVLVAVVFSQHTAAAAIAGFTAHTSTHYFSFYWGTILTRAVDGSEGATFTATGGTIYGQNMHRYSGVDPVAVIEGTPVAHNNATATATLPSITTVTDGAMLVLGVAGISGGTPTGFTFSGSMTDRADAVGSAAGQRTGLADETIPTAGATGTRTVTLDTVGVGPLALGLMIALKPYIPVPDYHTGDDVPHHPVTTVLISDPAGFATQRVPVTGISRSWVVNGSGSLSAEILSSDLVTYGLNDELRGHWIDVADEDAGHWGGVITDVQANGDGTTEIAATDWRALFDARRLPKRQRGLYGPAGTLALIAVTEAVRQHGTPIIDRTADDIGLPISFNLDGGDLSQALDGMANETGQEWWIDPETKAFRWGVKGTDLTGSVQVIEGRHITNWRLPTSLAPVVNDLEAYPTNDRYQAMQTITVENAASIAAVGRRQGSAGIAGGSHGIHIRNRAIGTVNELAALGQAIEFSLLNVDSAFTWFREGDTICALLPTISVQVALRITGRALDDSGVMSCSGIVTSRRALA